MSSLRTLKLTLALGLILSACESVEQPLGVEEPITATAPAVFKKGKLPGAQSDDATVSGTPEVSFSITGTTKQGAVNLALVGTANGATSAAGFRIAGEGTGYWQVNLGAEDLFMPGVFNWGAAIGLSFDLEPGSHDVIAVGFDKHGKPGKQTKQTICVQSDVFDNGNGCNPTLQPPAAVAVLRWNFDADIDLSVLSPASVRYDYKNAALLQDKKVLAELLGDSSPACVDPGNRSESFVWYDQPPAGTWYFYANLFDICGQAAVSYELTIYRRQDHGDGTFSLKEDKTFGGEFVRAQIETDNNKPLYLTAIKFP
ncbi:MAG: hypothetical protein QM778_23130 [Myxococcales bacterium]